jgi:peptidoglycan/xylan/chitin deacetylase (PgdA/CDA1 family)
MKRGWRAAAATAATLGLPAVLYRLRRRAPGRAIVLMYHRIDPGADPFGLNVHPDLFEQHLALLRRRMPVLRMRELAGRLRDPAPLKEDLAAITFDDGYRDNLEVALPILRRHGCVATIFVTTGFVDGSCRPIGERLASVFSAAALGQGPRPVWQDQGNAADAAIRSCLARPTDARRLQVLVGQLKGLATDDLERCLRRLEDLVHPHAAPQPVMLDWHGVRSLHEAGMEIASHTVTHPILARAPQAAVEHELMESKRALEAAIAAPVDGFAYPNGGESDFTTAHAAALSRLGYAYACSAIRGVNRPGSDPFRLRRIGIGNDSPALFDLKLALGGPVQACAAS